MHEEKNCPRGNQLFECRVGDIAHCQCRTVQLSLEVNAFIDAKYHDYLCVNCLQILKNKYNFFKEKYFLK